MTIKNKEKNKFFINSHYLLNFLVFILNGWLKRML